MFLAEDDRTRPMDMNITNAKLSLERALCFKQFQACPEKEFDSFLKRFFDTILDFRKTQNWTRIPIDNCRDYLQFPPVIHTGKSESPNELSFFTMSRFQPKIMSSFLSSPEYQNSNFHASILDNCSLKKSILNFPPLTGQFHGLEIVRFKTPYLYNQTGFNNESYKGFLIYNRVKWFDQLRVNETRLFGCDLKDTDKPNFFFKNCFKLWFCSCTAGARSKGSCVHVCALIMGLAANNDQRDLWKIIPTPSIDAETFPDTHISPDAPSTSRPMSSNIEASPQQPVAKRSRQ